MALSSPDDRRASAHQFVTRQRDDMATQPFAETTNDEGETLHKLENQKPFPSRHGTRHAQLRLSISARDHHTNTKPLPVHDCTARTTHTTKLPNSPHLHQNQYLSANAERLSFINTQRQKKTGQRSCMHNVISTSYTRHK